MFLEFFIGASSIFPLFKRLLRINKPWSHNRVIISPSPDFKPKCFVISDVDSRFLLKIFKIILSQIYSLLS